MDFTIDETIAAPPETVFDVLTDHRGYPDITPVRKARLEVEGEPAPNGVGAVRALEVVGPPMRERVTEYERPTRFVYELLSGLPLKNHTGTVTLSAAPAGTQLSYAVHTEAKVPVVGHGAMLVVRQAISGLIRGVKRESERRAATPAAPVGQ